MLNHVLAYLPALFGDPRDADESVIGKLVLWARQRIRYQRALHELHQLDDLGLAWIDFPELAWRHVTGAEPVLRLPS